MPALPASLSDHRVQASDSNSVVHGEVRWAPVQSLWFTCNSAIGVIGSALLFSWSGLALFVATTGIVLLFGHSLGSHRKLIHDSFQCPTWVAKTLVWLGVQVGLAGPIGLLRQHELRDYAQRLPDCHPYLRHGRPFWIDAWWQLHCQLRLYSPPDIKIEERIASDRFYRLLERTWMWQQLPLALLFYAWGGWGFVVFGVCARIATCVFGHWLIGHVAHNHGPMSHEVRGAAVQGHNVRWTSLLTMGEGWHNNHHAFPGSARLGLREGEWDPGWWVLLAMRRFGLAWSLRLPADLGFRPEVVQIPQLVGSAPRLADMARMLLWPARQESGELVWPGKRLGPLAIRRVTGGSTTFRLDGGAGRMTFQAGGRSLFGLPALWVAVLRHRGIIARTAGVLLAPLAIALEQGRRSFVT